jgi:hypothetical protein
MPSVPASFQDDLYEWLTAHAAEYLRALTGGADPREAFADYLRTGDAGAWFGDIWSPEAAGSHAKRYREATGGVWAEYGFRAGTGRLLAVDTFQHLRRYFAERSSEITRLCRLSDDPSDDTPEPIGPGQLQALLDGLLHTDDAELAVVLAPLLQGIAQGVLTFAGKLHRVVVTTRQGAWLTRPEAIATVHRRGVWVGRGGVSEEGFCQQVVAAAGVKRGSAGFSDVAILRDARKAQKTRG